MSEMSARGQLCIWTDIDPAHEQDFNRWYDREHMQERVAIPGFRSARRFRALGDGTLPYLALYETDHLAVFRSAAYRQAFANQSAWSLANFARMRGTQRRVGELVVDAGDGEGGALALVVIPPDAVARATQRAALARALAQDGVVRVAVQCTDVGLSSPLKADAPPVSADALLMVESTDAGAGVAHALVLAQELGLPDAEAHSFRLLWRIGA